MDLLLIENKIVAAIKVATRKSWFWSSRQSQDILVRPKNNRVKNYMRVANKFPVTEKRKKIAN